MALLIINIFFGVYLLIFFLLIQKRKRRLINTKYLLISFFIIMALNYLKKFKNLFGGLDINSIKSGLNYGRKFINIAKGINELGQKHNIDAVNKITDRLINNKNFKQFE